MFDITTITATATAFMHLKSPADEEPIYIGTGESKQPVGITFHSPGSPIYEGAVSLRTNRALARAKRKVEINADLLRSDVVQFLSDVTASFDNLAYPPAGDATGPDLFRALYSDRSFAWATEQANAFMGDWGNFTKKSTQS